MKVLLTATQVRHCNWSKIAHFPAIQLQGYGKVFPRSSSAFIILRGLCRKKESPFSRRWCHPQRLSTLKVDFRHYAYDPKFFIAVFFSLSWLQSPIGKAFLRFHKAFRSRGIHCSFQICIGAKSWDMLWLVGRLPSTLAWPNEFQNHQRDQQGLRIILLLLNNLNINSRLGASFDHLPARALGKWEFQESLGQYLYWYCL